MLDTLWRAAEPKVYIGKDEFLSWFDGCEVRPVEMEGELAFITVQKGPEFHFHSLGTGKRISLAMIRDFLTKSIDQHGYALTKTPHADARQHRFNKRFGFVEIGRDAFDVHYRIESLPHA